MTSLQDNADDDDDTATMRRDHHANPIADEPHAEGESDGSGVRVAFIIIIIIYPPPAILCCCLLIQYKRQLKSLSPIYQHERMALLIDWHRDRQPANGTEQPYVGAIQSQLLSTCLDTLIPEIFRDIELQC